MQFDYGEICYECTGYGDDWYFDENGNLVSACADCWVAKQRDEEEGELHGENTRSSRYP